MKSTKDMICKHPITISLKLSSNLTNIDAIFPPQKKRGIFTPSALHLQAKIRTLLSSVIQLPDVGVSLNTVMCFQTVHAGVIVRQELAFKSVCFVSFHVDMNVKCLRGKKINIKSHLTSS